MDTNKRNELTLSFEKLAWWTIHRNATLLQALNLEYDDVFQDLMIAAMNAIEGFDPRRSESLFTHVRCKMQYSILRMRRQHKPCGMTGASKANITFVSIQSNAGSASETDIAFFDDISYMDAAALLSQLSCIEQETVKKKADGHTLRLNAEKHTLQSAKSKTEALFCVERQYA